MKTLNFEQMEVIQGGIKDIDWCEVGRGITAGGLIGLGLSFSFCCPVAGAAYGLIAGATVLYC